MRHAERKIHAGTVLGRRYKLCQSKTETDCNDCNLKWVSCVFHIKKTVFLAKVKNRFLLAICL